MIIKDEGPKFTPTPEGLHIATCVQIADIGPQESTFQGETKTQRKIILVFELPTIRREWEKDGVKHEGPSQISGTYTISLHEKSNLRKLLAGWRGRDFNPEEMGGFDIEQCLGTQCQILVKHEHKNDRTYANIESAIKYTGEKLEPEAELVCYDSNSHDETKFKKLHPWIQKKVILPDGSYALKEGDNASSTQDLAEDDIPF